MLAKESTSGRGGLVVCAWNPTGGPFAAAAEEVRAGKLTERTAAAADALD